MSSIPRNIIDVWNIFLPDCDPFLAEYRTLLTADETERANAFHHAGDSGRFVLSRGILRRILGNYLNVPPASIRFERNKNGKPFLPGSELHFNVSHSRDRLLIAVTAGRAVGIDIECHRTNVNMAAIAERWFSNEEKEFFHSTRGREAGAERRQRNEVKWQSSPALSDEGAEGKNMEKGFFDIWSKKEAFVKAQGLGIFHGLSHFTVPLGTDPQVPMFGNSDEWIFQTLDLSGAKEAPPHSRRGNDRRERQLDPSYAAALVYEAPAVPVRIRSLHP